MQGAGARVVPAALLLLLLATAGAVDEPLEDEVESAPFAIVVDHEDGWRCGGAMVSLRVALSSASCARGRGPTPPADLWARAPGAPASAGARRVARIAVPIEAEGATEGATWSEEAWLGAALDMAVLELEAQFGAAARARPILMAAGGECTAARSCLAVRTPPHAAAPLRVGNATLAPGNVCAAAAPHWLAVADTVMCLTGPQFCSSDWGVGVVCAGKLCGVLSRSTRGAHGAGEADDAGGAGEEGCGTTHAAQHVPSWRAFVHCAQTRHHCGRDSCASVCSERMLLEELAGDSTTTKAHSSLYTKPEDDEGGETKARVTSHSTPLTQSEMERESEWRSRTPARDAGARRAGEAGRSGAEPGEAERAGAEPAGRPTRTTPLTFAKDAPPTGRMAQFEFEPYRADFKIGEYGDNAASYDSGEEAPTRTPPSRAPESSRVPEALVSESERRPPPAAPPAPVPATAPPARRDLPMGPRTKKSRAHVHRNTLAPYFCIFLIGIYRRLLNL